MALIDWDAVAASYDASRGTPLEALAAWRDVLGGYLSALDRPVLDVGAGTGVWAAAFAEWYGARVVGIEPSAGMVREAVRLHSHPLVAYSRGTAEALPLRDGSCGAAWLSTVIHHFERPRAAIREIRRVLTDNAPALIRSSFPGRHDGITLFRYFPAASEVASRFPAVEQVVEAAAGEGFVFEALLPVPQLTAPNLHVARERVLGRADTTLRLISDDDFAAGLARMDAAIAAGEGEGPVVDYIDLLVLRRLHCASC